MAKAKPAAPEVAVDEGHELRMGFFEHLGELRNRLLKAVLALAIGTGIGSIFAPQGLEILRIPFCNLVDTTEGCQFQLLDPTGGIIVYFRVALLIGGILSIPVMTYQVIMFIMPGLTNKERRNVLLALPGITLLFILGVLFAWYVLLPPALTFLNGFLPDLFRPEWTADGYLSFVTSLIFWMGVAFESPLVFFVLSLMGLVTARLLITNWRIAIVGAAIAAAFITPTVDPVNMFLVMGPLMTLYLLSIFLVFIGSRINGISSK
jgi:sec-independent protein translocase protein TatC